MFVKAACRIIQREVASRIRSGDEATVLVRQEGQVFHVELSVRRKGDPLLIGSTLHLGTLPVSGGLNEVVAGLVALEKRIGEELTNRVRQNLSKGG